MSERDERDWIERCERDEKDENYWIEREKDRDERVREMRERQRTVGHPG